ncbi:MAG: TRAP transporter small permease [Clostridiales bacterium]|nr:TRAP transporter small permease [Clostridiales bacterium]
MKRKLLFLLDHAEEIVLVPGFAIMLLIGFCNVLSRFILHQSWSFTEEMCVMMFVYVTFFGASVAVKRKAHLGFTLYLDKSRGMTRIVLDTFIMLAVVLFLVLMVVYGVKVCQNQLKYKAVTAALRISTAYASASVPIGGACILLRIIQMYVRDIRADIREYHALKERKKV